MTIVNNVQAPPAIGPQVPDISKKQLVKQFWADIYGKEVQDAWRPIPMSGWPTRWGMSAWAS